MGRSRDLADGKLTELLDVEQSTGHSVQLDHTSTSGYSSVAWAENGTIKAYSAHFGTTDGSGERLQHWVASNAPITFGTNNTERMRIDSSGRVTMPYQPMAVARVSSDVQGSSDLLLFDTTDINIGSHYNTSLKRFTAPVAGRYYIAVEVQFHSGATQIYTGIKVNKNGGQVCDAYTNQYASNAHARITVNRVFELSANDYLEVRVAGSAGTYPTVQGGGGNRTAFTCFLLS